MAVKKATSAGGRGVPPKKAAPKIVVRAGATKQASKASTKPGVARAGSARVTAKKAGATRAGGAKVTAKKAVTKAAVAKVTAKKIATKVTSGLRGGSTSAGAQRLRVRENEKPWTVSELAAVRSELEADIARLTREISVAEVDLAGLMRDVGDGAGDDPADAGTATFEREQEISLANNARGVLDQSARALARLLDGTYGICESCGSPIGKNRLQAFPRATLCLPCKSKQERR